MALSEREMEIYSITSPTLTFLEDILLLCKVGTGRILSLFTSEVVSLRRPAVCLTFAQPLPQGYTASPRALGSHVCSSHPASLGRNDSCAEIVFLRNEDNTF